MECWQKSDNFRWIVFHFMPNIGFTALKWWELYLVLSRFLLTVPKVKFVIKLIKQHAISPLTNTSDCNVNEYSVFLWISNRWVYFIISKCTGLMRVTNNSFVLVKKKLYDSSQAVYSGRNDVRVFAWSPMRLCHFNETVREVDIRPWKTFNSECDNNSSQTKPKFKKETLVLMIFPFFGCSDYHNTRNIMPNWCDYVSWISFSKGSECAIQS